MFEEPPRAAAGLPSLIPVHPLSLRLALALLLGLTGMAADEPATMARRPNVLFIAMDDLNNWVGCLGGHPQTRTPNLDRLAARGTLFTNAYCPAPACNPSRSAIFTGIPPRASGIYNNSQRMREALPEAEIIPKYFSRHGYWSAGSGKMLHYFVDADSWDEYFPAKALENPFPETHNPPTRPVSLPFEKWMYADADWGRLDLDDEAYGGDHAVAKWVGAQLRQPHDRPFFLACGIYKPHEPWFIPKKYFEPFPLDTIVPGPGYKPDDLEDVPPAGQKLARNRYFEHIQKNHQWKQAIQAYLAAIHYADAMLGRVLDALDASPDRENTIVVLWSDHGWHLGEKEHWQKYTGWRLSARVPLIIHVPPGVPGLPVGTPAGSVSSRPVSLGDLYRTLLDLCQLPDKPAIFGRSLVPLLKDPAAAWEEAPLTHLANPGDYALSTERWRYLHYSNGDEELYDVATDPHEWTNLAQRPEFAPRLAAMRALVPKDIKPAYESQPGISAIQPDDFVAFVPVGRGPVPASHPVAGTVNLIFRNQAGGPVKLFSVDAAGRRELVQVIPVTSRHWVRTQPGTVWVVADDRGVERGYFVAGETDATGGIQFGPR